MFRKSFAYLVLVLMLVLAACGSDNEGMGSSPSPTAEPEPTAAIATPTQVATATPTAAATEVSDDFRLDGQICCGTHGEIGGENYLFVMTLGGGEQEGHGALHVLHVGNQATLERVGTIDTPHPLSLDSLTGTSRIAFSDGVIYLPVPGRQIPGGLWTVDVSDPAAPVELALVETELPPMSVAVSGNVAAVAVQSFEGPAVFFNISDPAIPQVLGEAGYMVWSMPPAIEFADSMLYIAGRSGVTIINAATPESATIVAEYANPDWDGPPTTRGDSISGLLDGIARAGTFQDVAVADGYLYVAASDAGVRIVDITDPANPEETHQFELLGRPIRVTASGNQLHVLTVDMNDERSALNYYLHWVEVSPSDNSHYVRYTGTLETVSPFWTFIPGPGPAFLLGSATIHSIGIDWSPDDSTPEPAFATPTREATNGASDGIPTPDERGRCVAFSIEEAQTVTIFPLVLPTEIPEALQFSSLHLYKMAAAGPDDFGDCDDTDYVETWYSVTAAGQHASSIRFVQTTFKAEFGSHSARKLDVEGKDVTAYSTSVNDNAVTFYVWYSGDLSYVLEVPSDSPVDEDDLLAMIASVQ